MDHQHHHHHHQPPINGKPLDHRHMSLPTLNIDQDLLFDHDYPLIDQITGEPAAYVLMKHLNQIVVRNNPVDENNNRLELLNTFRQFRSGSLDLGSNGSSGDGNGDDDDDDDDKDVHEFIHSNRSNISNTASTTTTNDTHIPTDLEPDTSVMFMQPASLMLELSGIHSPSLSNTSNDSQDDKDSTKPNYLLGPADHCACEICLDEQPMHRRLCCNFAACNNCLSAYYEHRLQLGQFSIECINTVCQVPAARDEIRALLSSKSQEIYRALLIVNNDLGKLTRTCPHCNHLYRLKDSSHLKTMRNKRRKDQTACRVQCEQCGHFWCFLCHAPWHQQITCKQFQAGDQLLRNWAKQINQGQVNAQKCPTCKTFIQRSSGCDHMHCRNCQTDFCYRCGEKLRHLKFFGNHYSKLSVFGCKYRYKSEQPILRRTIRVSVFCAKLAAAPALCSAAVAAVGVAVAVGAVVLPLYGLVRLGRWTADQQKRKENRGRSFNIQAPPSNAFRSQSTGSYGGRVPMGSWVTNIGMMQQSNNIGSSSSNNCSVNHEFGGVRFLTGARNLQRLANAKNQTHPRLGSFPLDDELLGSYGTEWNNVKHSQPSSINNRPTNGSESDQIRRKDRNGFKIQSNQVDQQPNNESDHHLFSSLDQKYISPFALHNNVVSGNGLDNAKLRRTNSGMFTMDFDSLDRLEHWSLNRTLYGMGHLSATRNSEVVGPNLSDIGRTNQKNKSKTMRSIKKNFLLTSIF